MIKIKQMLENYNRILQNEFEHFDACYFGMISFEEFSTKVDTYYREKYQCFPISFDNEEHDEDVLSERLRSACIHVGSELIYEIEHQIEEHEFESGVEWMCEFLENELESFLKYRKTKVKWGFPYNRRFFRKDAFTITKGALMPTPLEDNLLLQLEKAITILQGRGLLKLIETTNDSRHDVFEYVNV